MDQRVLDYIHHGKFQVEGWLHTEAALAIAALGERQGALGVRGGTLEIGVHHGKLFILLYLMGRTSEKAVAIDLFGDQHLNVDQSGAGDLERFRRNLERHGDTRRLVLHQGNSLDLASADLIRLADGPLRLASIDGGHTARHAAHDLGMVEAALAEGGIVIVDDVFNERWPGVAEGVHRYLAARPNLVPFAIGANKTYFSRPSHREIYRDALISAVPSAVLSDFLGGQVAIPQFARRGLKDRFAHTAAWRRMRTTPLGRPLRWAWHAGRRLRRSLVRREDF